MYNLNNYFIPNWYDANELLSVVDILITDYSSIFFDFYRYKTYIFLYERQGGLYFLSVVFTLK